MPVNVGVNTNNWTYGRAAAPRHVLRAARRDGDPGIVGHHSAGGLRRVLCKKDVQLDLRHQLGRSRVDDVNVEDEQLAGRLQRQPDPARHIELDDLARRGGAYVHCPFGVTPCRRSRRIPPAVLPSAPAESESVNRMK